ncbi:MAG TPA: TonB-dependent receptor [Flavitalea sp.]|nr:TonB-dependent receptor [Flavitalea sp.]
MKCTIAIMLLACLQVSANGFSQSRITVNLHSIEMKRALSLIERKSDFRFLYNQKLLSDLERVEINAVNEEVTSVLDRIFQNTPLSYQVLANNLVVLKPKNTFVADIRVTGKVTSTTGEGIPGVSVSVKGSTVGTSTDAAGNFALTAPEGATLVFSSVGFETQEIPVNSRTSINISMKESTGRSMDEVVVIGYGTASKRDLTGSIVKIQGKEVADKPNTNPVASLQGKVAGLSVVNSGTPGREPDIRVRGTSSIGQVKPLYVVDGIFQDNINYINPNDIESIEVLKDPSSLAIFGVRGATGVIAITTKKARAGQTIVSLSTNYGFKKLTDKIQFVDAAGFKTLFAQERLNNGTTDPYDYTGLTGNTDWINAVTRTGTFNANNLNVSSSTDKNRFAFGIGYNVDQGIIKNEQLKRLTLALTDEFKLNKFIKMGVNLNFQRQNNPYDATWVLDAARKVAPIFTNQTRHLNVRNPYANDTIPMDVYSGLDVGLQSAGVVNPLVALENEWDKVKDVEYRSVGSVFAEISFLKYFTWRSTGYADMSNQNKRIYEPRYYTYNPRTLNPELAQEVTSVQEEDNTWRKFQQDHVLTFKNDFGDHALTLTGGFTTYYSASFKRTSKVSQADPSLPTSLAIPDDPRFWYISSGFEDPTSRTATSDQSDYATVSYLARALYNYQGKYFLNASFRNDASSRLPKATRDQQFWALGAAWELTKENFMAGQNIVDAIKLKGSVGVLGNQSTINPNNGSTLNNPFYPNLLTGTTAVFGTSVYGAADQAYQANPDLRWETVSAWEVGVEGTSFKNRLNFEANYFSRTTKNLLTYISERPGGLKDELINGGEIKNTGVELSAAWSQTINEDISVSIGGNITFIKNRVLALNEKLPSGLLIRGFQNNGSAEARTVAGRPIGSFWGYVVEGIYQSQADIQKSPNASSLGAYRPGDFKFKDMNGDGTITSDDRTFIGNPTPDFTYGTSVNVGWKGLSLAVDFNGVYGNEVFRTWGSLESPFQRVNYSAEKLGAWHGAGTSNWVPIISQGDRFNYNGSTYNIEDGSYFRIRNVQLGYAIPNNVVSRAYLKSVRVFVNVQNLKTFKNNIGYSPEFPGDATAFGFDNADGALPIVTTFGLNVTF